MKEAKKKEALDAKRARDGEQEGDADELGWGGYEEYYTKPGLLERTWDGPADEVPSGQSLGSMAQTAGARRSDG